MAFHPGAVLSIGALLGRSRRGASTVPNVIMVVLPRYGTCHIFARRGNGRPHPANGRPPPQAAEPRGARRGGGVCRTSRSAQRARTGARAGDPRAAASDEAEPARQRGRSRAEGDSGRQAQRRPATRSRMIVHVDTSALVDALTGPRRSLPALIALTDEGHRAVLSTIILYEWLRGP